MTTYVAFLRGINVGGKNLLPMKELAGLFSEAGCHRVQTYIQSGNVIFEASEDVSASLSGVIAARIAAQFGYHTPVVLRSASQLKEVIENNPFLTAGVVEEVLHVMFLADLPRPHLLEALDPDRCPPDAFVVRGQEIYLHLPGGAGRTKLTNAYFDAKLATVSTQRNWRTVKTLLNLIEAQN